MIFLRLKLRSASGWDKMFEIQIHPSDVYYMYSDANKPQQKGNERDIMEKTTLYLKLVTGHAVL